MDEAPCIYPNLSDVTQFELNKINKIKDYFIAEIRERETTIKRLSKYIAAFDYFDKALIVLSGASGGISIIAFSTIFGTPVGITGASFAFSLATGIVENYWKTLEKNSK